MTSNASLAYPAEYYYSDILDGPSDNARRTPPTHNPLTNAVDNGVGSTVRMPVAVSRVNELGEKKIPTARKRAAKSLAVDVVTNQGLPDIGIADTLKTDPKKNLLRDPVEKNIPRLIVDDSLFNQSGRTPRALPGQFDGMEPVDATKKAKLIPDTQPFTYPNGHANGDLNRKTKTPIDHNQAALAAAWQQQAMMYGQEEEQPIDDFWKKELQINEEGLVSIEPVKYDRNKYDGPFGLTRQPTIIYFIFMGFISVGGAIILIVLGIFYSQSSTGSTSRVGYIAGMAVGAFVFYLGLQLILIAIWHQKYSQENPKKIVNAPGQHNDSTAHLKTSMETEPYDYGAYSQQQIDYSSYGGYSQAPYVSNPNEQMFAQQPGGVTSAYYDPSTWPSNVEFDSSVDPRFYQPMDTSYGHPSMTAAPVTQNSHPAESPKVNPDNLFPNSTVTETTISVSKKASETNEIGRARAPLAKLMRAEQSNALRFKSVPETERMNSHAITGNGTSARLSNRVQPSDTQTDLSTSKDSQRRHGHHSRHRRHHNHRHHRHHRRSSYSSCSTCSRRSPSDIRTDVENLSKILTSRPTRAHTFSSSRTRPPGYRNNSIRTDINTKESSVTIGLEDVPNVRDDRFEQIPVVRRTIIVEPYPAPPSSQLTVQPVERGLSIAPDTDKTKKATKKDRMVGEPVEDLQLEDVNDDDRGRPDKYHQSPTGKSKKKRTAPAHTTLMKSTGKNAFYG